MYHESRIKKTLLNAKVNTICYFLNLVISFFSRKIFIDHLGVEFMGLQGTLYSLLGFLNLAELGIGTAIGYVLYQPIYDGDKEKIKEVVSVFGYLYRWIGNVILIGGIILSFFLPLIFPDTGFSMGVIFLGFYALLFSSVLAYFANYRSVLLSADQRNYEVTGYFQIVQVIKTFIQMALAYFITSFALYFVIEIVFALVYTIVLNYRINIIYPWLKTERKLGHKLLEKYPVIGRSIKQVFVHRIGGFVQFQLLPIIIYGNVSLAVVALYANYTTISEKLQGFINAILNSTSAGVGNLISEGDKDKIYELFKELFAFRFLVAGILSTCFYFLASDFVTVWLGGQYVLSSLVVLLVAVMLFFRIARQTTDQFINGYGLFYDIWAPIVESCLFVILSVILGHFYQLEGVLWGPVISTALIIFIWKPYFLFAKGMKISVGKYWRLFFTHLLGIIAAAFLSSYLTGLILPGQITDWIDWIVSACVFTSIMSVTSFVFLFFFADGLKGFICRLLAARKII